MKKYIFFQIIILTAIICGCHSEANSSAEQWTETIKEMGGLTADINGDGKDDSIEISYLELEGSQYIAEFKVAVAGCDAYFTLTDYDASFEKIELADLDNDHVDEIIFMFDTHGGGGEGTHDIYVLWLGENQITSQQLTSADIFQEDIDSKWNVDDIYDISIVNYKGKERIQTRQYMWGEYHADRVGDKVSILSYDAERGTFVVEESYIDSLSD